MVTIRLSNPEAKALLFLLDRVALRVDESPVNKADANYIANVIRRAVSQSS